MAHTVDSQMSTPGADLRQSLDRAERQLPTLKAGDVGDYLRSLDHVQQIFDLLSTAAADLRPEMTRWLDLQTRLGARAGQLVKLAGAEGGFAALRNANPPATGAWWRLDELVAVERKRMWTRAAATLAAIVLVLAVAAFVYQRFLAPSQEVVMVMGTINDVEQLALEKRWDEATALVGPALQEMPTEPDLLIWAAVLAERRGAADEAADYRAQAERAVGNAVQYQLTLGMRRLQAGDLEGAEAAALAVQAINADEPQATFLLASVAESRGQTQEALDLFQRTSELAEKTDNAQLTVVAKMRYGMLLQQFQYSFEPSAEEGGDVSAETTPITPTAAPAP